MEKVFSLDRHVFNILISCALFSIIVYSMGVTVPAWYVVHEDVRNVTSCVSMDYYVTDDAGNLVTWHQDIVTVDISASLWYIKIRINNTKDDFDFTNYIPFSALRYDNIPIKKTGEGIAHTGVSSSHYLILLVIILLISGLVFSFRSSTRPSRVIYYGLSIVAIVTGMSIWVASAIPASQSHVISLVSHMCIKEGIISSSVFLHIITGSAAILSFVFGCILLLIAIVINSRLKASFDHVDIFNMDKGYADIKYVKLKYDLIS